MDNFDLTTQPWIPCLHRGTVTELGLRDALSRAHELDEVIDASPLVTIALHRLLLALIHSMFRPLDGARWQEIWQRGQLPAGVVEAYLDRWSHRFDLFHPERPFYQVPKTGFSPYLEKYEKSVAELTLDRGASNADMFAHTPEPFLLSTAEAARTLVTRHLYAAAGTHSHEQGQLRDKFAADGPVARAALCLLRGGTLFETLLLNTVDYVPEDERPFPADANDCPAWEAEHYARAEGLRPRGYLDWLTWQSRRILLLASADQPNMVDRVVFMKGGYLQRALRVHDYEQMCAFRKVENPKQDQDPIPPLNVREDRALWRDSIALLTPAEGPHSPGDPPRTLRQAAERHVARAAGAQLAAGGVLFKSGQMMVILWRSETLPVAVRYYESTDLQGSLRQAVGFAEAVGTVLNQATHIFATGLLAPAAGEPGGRKGDPKAITALTKSLSTSLDYWGSLGAAFETFLVDQASEDPGVPEAAALRAWTWAVGRAARSALRRATSAAPSGRNLKAMIAAQGRLHRGIASARRSYNLTFESKAGEVEHALAAV